MRVAASRVVIVIVLGPLLVGASSWGWEGRPRLARLHAYFDSPFSSFSVEQSRWGCSSHIDGSDA